MKIKFMAALLLSFFSVSAFAQSTSPKVTNTVVEQDGKLFVQTTTVAQVEATSDLVSQKIESLQQEREKMLQQVGQIDNSITELQKLFFDLQKKERKMKPKAGDPVKSEAKN